MTWGEWSAQRLDLACPIAGGVALEWGACLPTLPPAVGDLRDFVRSHLGNPELPFDLCECFLGTSFQPPRSLSVGA